LHTTAQRAPVGSTLAVKDAPRYTVVVLIRIEVVMSTDVAEIEAKIRTLSPEDRAELIRVLIADLDGPADADVERAWLEEAQRRHREVVEGKVAPVPGERVFANLRARLKR
jgi:putative addiction module component (TIGR02574 family)